MGAKRKSYTPKYRQEAAHLVIDTGRTIAAVAREIGVGEQLLGRWVAIERSRMDDPPEAVDADERAELVRLRREVAELRMDREFLKKSGGLLRGGELEPEQAFAVIDAQKAGPEMPPVTRMADLLGVSRSGYYAWAARQDGVQLGPRAARRADLVVKIKVAHDASDGVNGAPRILADLRAAGEVVSRKTVAKLMRANGLRGISPRPWRPVTTIADQHPHTIPDLVQRRFDRGALNLVWTSDITYLATGQGWLYLCAVRDGCSRRVLGYAFADNLHTDLVETALRRAVTFRDPATGSTAGVIFHADRGCQYVSTQLARAAEEVQVRLSVGRTGVCWDNAQQESFWSTLKTEYYDRHTFDTHTEAITAVSTWIDTVYNQRRRHSSLGQISPIAFENTLITAADQAA
ncbi:IS3 family transposase [Calidifontibacter sp. DB0510]|uniref:IS3 family transposase n=2 Tax=Metallococcus carri TaxID=1656884 RepID=A0A967B9R5_9MICO|nr:IS3 family transposase [Metallococcus carri]NHN57461.1 IS3 family transposase [Metallococcus carri]